MASSLADNTQSSFDTETLLKRSSGLQFDFAQFFSGHTRASGWFSDRFGKPRRHFCGDFYGSSSDDTFRLDENLYYTDGVTESKVWEIQISESGIFTAESESLLNGAHGFIQGDTLRMKYSMRIKIDTNRYWDLDMKDTMVLQPDGSLHNTVQVYKWGIRIGTVSSQYQHHDGSDCCASMIMKSSSSAGKRHLASVG